LKVSGRLLAQLNVSGFPFSFPFCGPIRQAIFELMQFTEGSVYHIYNRGNDKRVIFFQERNYRYFIEKVEKYILPCSNLLAWCLMPNHFHFLIQARASSITILREYPVRINSLTEGIRMLLSSYTKGIQKQETITGNLFQQKTKFKCVDDYLATAFHYIHQNPRAASLVHRLEDWKWSSLQEYLGLSQTVLCNKEIAHSYLDLERNRLLENSYEAISEEAITKIL